VLRCPLLQMSLIFRQRLFHGPADQLGRRPTRQQIGMRFEPLDLLGGRLIACVFPLIRNVGPKVCQQKPSWARCACSMALAIRWLSSARSVVTGCT
jgi:hypothetical protein